MKMLALVIIAMSVLGGCQGTDPAAYHHAAAHPYRVSEASVRVSLVNATGEAAAARAVQFAAERPNNGSSFIVSAGVEAVNAVRIALLRAGIDPRDIRVIPDGAPAEIVRTDRFVAVSGCQSPPERTRLREFLFGTEDGFRHDNSNSQLLGCSIQRNFIEMLDDPRVVAGPVYGSDRNGERGSTVMDKYRKGENPTADFKLPNWKTSEMTKGTDQ